MLLKPHVVLLIVSALAVDRAWPADQAPHAAVDAQKPVPAAPAAPAAYPAPKPREHLPDAVDAFPRLTKRDIPGDLPADLKALIEGTYSDSPVERGKAAKSLGEQHDRARSAVPFLIRLLADDGGVETRYFRDVGPGIAWDETVGDKASEAIRNIGKSAVEPCLAALKECVGTKRGDKVVYVLAAMNDPRAVEPLVALLGHRDPLVRIAAVNALSTWTDNRVVSRLIESLKDEDSEVREATAQGMHSHRDARFVAPLIEALGDSSADVRRYAAHSLGEQRDPRAVPALLTILRDQAADLGLREASAKALGSIAEQRGLDELLAVIKNRTLPDDLRQSAAYGLMQSKDAQYFQQLADQLGDPKEARRVRSSIAACIANLDRQKAIPILVRISGDANDDAFVRWGTALLAVTFTDGAIDDLSVIHGFEAKAPDGPFPYGESIAEVSDGAESKRRAFRLMLKNGKSTEVRNAAKAWLERYAPTEKSPRADPAPAPPEKPGDSRRKQ